MFKTTQLGKLLQPDDKRDAIHIAVAPMICSDDEVRPGQHVGLTEADDHAGTTAEKKIGIVDPFLTQIVLKGQRFWLFLYPNTITSLRHDWHHPAFEGDVIESKAWIVAFAKKLEDQTYDSLMELAHAWVNGADYTYDNSESYKDVWHGFGDFWKHYEIVTGQKVPDDKKECFFTCSC